MSPDHQRNSFPETSEDPLGRFHSEFADHLSQKGLAPETVRRHMGPARHFLSWLELTETPLQTVADDVLHRFVAHDCTCPVPPFKFNRLHNHEAEHFVGAVCAFVHFLERTGRSDVQETMLSYQAPAVSAAGALPRQINILSRVTYVVLC